MTLDEAIKVLDDIKDSGIDAGHYEAEDAIELGIEALKFRLRWEQQEGEDNFPLLPGETKERS